MRRYFFGSKVLKRRAPKAVFVYVHRNRSARPKARSIKCLGRARQFKFIRTRANTTQKALLYVSLCLHLLYFARWKLLSIQKPFIFRVHSVSKKRQLSQMKLVSDFCSEKARGLVLTLSM